MRHIIFASALLIAALIFPAQALARQGSFVEPGAGTTNVTGGPVAQALSPEPPETDIGETQVGVAKRATLFFANTSNAPIDFVKFEVLSDSNVSAELDGNDCEKLKSLPARERCSVTLSISPISGGAWTAQLLVQHSGPGRVTRAEVYGTSLAAATDEEGRERTGLSLNNNEVEAIDFTSIEAGFDRAVRTVLLVNDSGEMLKVLDIELIAADNGLARLDQGCKEAEELRPGESCPITIVWQPQSRGMISTDLIVRHTGRQGFMVVPVRGTASGDDSLPERARLPLARDGVVETADSASEDFASGGVSGNDPAANGGMVSAPPKPNAGSAFGAGADNGIDSSSLGLPPLPIPDEDEDLPIRSSRSRQPALPEITLRGIIGQRAVVKAGEAMVVLVQDQPQKIDGLTLSLVKIERRTVTVMADDAEIILNLNAKPVFKLAVNDQGDESEEAEALGDEEDAEGSASRGETASLAVSGTTKIEKTKRVPRYGKQAKVKVEDTARGMASAPPVTSTTDATSTTSSQSVVAPVGAPIAAPATLSAGAP